MAENRSRGLADVVAASTALSDIDGRSGRLCYRGYDIDQLAGTASFEEVAYLLQRGSPAGLAELDGYRGELTAGRALGPLTAASVAALARGQQPVAALRSLVSLAGADDPDAGCLEPAADLRRAVRLTAQQPVLVAALQAARAGRPAPEPAAELGLAANFLLQLTGRPPAPRAAEIFDACLVLQADHAMNAATFAARVCAATLSDLHSAVVAALCALGGPLHGGASGQVMRGLEAIRESGDGDPVEAVTRQVAQWGRQGKRVAGFGHRAYLAADPRAAHLRQLSAELAAAGDDDTYHLMARRMEDEVLSEQGLYPNADFYAATAYHYLAIPTDLFTAVFSIARMAGWTAHVVEQHADNRLIRPGSEYVGERGLTWTPVAGR